MNYVFIHAELRVEISEVGGKNPLINTRVSAPSAHL